MCPPVILISGCSFAEPEASLLKQIAILQAANGGIDMDIVTNHPMYHRQILCNEFLLCFR